MKIICRYPMDCAPPAYKYSWVNIPNRMGHYLEKNRNKIIAYVRLKVDRDWARALKNKNTNVVKIEISFICLKTVNLLAEIGKNLWNSANSHMPSPLMTGYC